MAEQFVVFGIGQERYGLDVSLVVSIERMLPITRMPHADDFVLGVINLRGEIIPVIDTCRRLGLEPSEETEASRIIIVQYRDYKVGLKVDAVFNVMHFDTQRMQEFDKITAENKAQYFNYVIHDENDIILVPNIPRLLDIDEF